MSDNSISDVVFQHTAKLSCLKIKPEEYYIKDQLAQAADYVAVLKELNTDNVLPTFQVNRKSNVLREDVVGTSLPQSVALSQAQNVSHGYFKTAATIDKKK